MYLIIILVIITLLYYFSLEHFMPMDTFETRMPCLVKQRYSYDDRPRPLSNNSIIYPEYARLFELPINYDPTIL